jgi:hypothetical protein
MCVAPFVRAPARASDDKDIDAALQHFKMFLQRSEMFLAAMANLAESC